MRSGTRSRDETKVFLDGGAFSRPGLSKGGLHMRRSFIAVLGIVVLAAFGAVMAETERMGNDALPMDQTTPPTGGTNEAGSTSGSSREHHEQMPRTASPLPLVALIGVLSVGTALALRAITRLGS